MAEGCDDSPVRMTWRRLRRALDRRKVPAGGAPLSGRLDGRRIEITPARGTSRETPVLLAATYHPRRRRTDGRGVTDGPGVYAASPFLMLTCGREPTNLAFERAGYERAAFRASGATLPLLLSLRLREGRALRTSRGRNARPSTGCST